jgi:hypothetical protein
MHTAEAVTIGALSGFILGTIYKDVLFGFYHKEVSALRTELRGFTDFITKRFK